MLGVHDVDDQRCDRKEVKCKESMKRYTAAELELTSVRYRKFSTLNFKKSKKILDQEWFQNFSSPMTVWHVSNMNNPFDFQKLVCFVEFQQFEKVLLIK